MNKYIFKRSVFIFNMIKPNRYKMHKGKNMWSSQFLRVKGVLRPEYLRIAAL